MRNKFFSSIRARMLTIYILVTLFALVSISLMVSGIVESFLVTQRTRNQTQETARLALEIAPDVLGTDVNKLYERVTERAQSMGGRVLVLDTDAVVQMDSASQKNGYRLPYREVRDVLIGNMETSYGFHRISRGPEHGLLAGNSADVWAVYYTAPITSQGIYVGVVLFSTLIQDVADSVNEVINSIMVIFFVVSLIMIAVTYMLSGWLTKPIVELTAAIRSMGRRGYGVRVGVRGGGEIAELGIAFNRMSERIEAHDQVRDEFIANASHELKTPLSTMKLLSESILYQENPNPELMKEFFLDVNNEVDRLSRIVTELLSLVQNDQVGAKPQLRYQRLDQLVDETMNRLKPLADKKGITFLRELLPVNCMLEWTRMGQVVSNLVENAIKYTDEGTVHVRVWQDEHNAYLSVKDTGIGIPEESLAHLFERFYRVDKARSRGTGGTGLGLAIVEEIIIQHGGNIDVISEVGRGSTFTVSLPLHLEGAEE